MAIKVPIANGTIVIWALLDLSEFNGIILTILNIIATPLLLQSSLIEITHFIQCFEQPTCFTRFGLLAHFIDIVGIDGGFIIFFQLQSEILAPGRVEIF